MVSIIGLFRDECTRLLSLALASSFPKFMGGEIGLGIPPAQELGDLTSSISFEIGRELKVNPLKVAERIVSAMDLSSSKLVASVRVGGEGYINFYLDYGKATPSIIRQAIEEDEEYGFEKTTTPQRIIVEHTSANPSGPLHVGHARNAIIGDALVRMLRARGHDARAHFYIDDVGKQVAMLAYGYKLLGEPEPEGKPDEWFGYLYACTNCAVEMEAIRSELRNLGEVYAVAGMRQRLDSQLKDWGQVAKDLEAIDAKTFHKVLDAVRVDIEPMRRVEELMKAYEEGEPAARALVRKSAEKCLAGIMKTLGEMGIGFDSWDWESELVWSGEVRKVVSKLKESGYTYEDGGALVLDAQKIVDDFKLREALGLTDGYEVPPLTLMTRYGTTLYPTRDIAYTIKKFQSADRVINVIGAEQKLTQLQLKLALHALAETRMARNLLHHAYGLVELPGTKMSKRRSRYVTLDEILEQATVRALEEVRKRAGDIDENEAREIAKIIAHGAIRYAMISVSSSKNITFTWDRVLSFERNSAPFINYAYTRALGILRKVGQIPAQVEYALLQNPLERYLIFQIGIFPEVFTEAADNLRADQIANFANSLAEKFHEYYEKVNVLRAEREGLKYARASLVKAIKIVLRNAMAVLGIGMSERM